MAKWGDGRESGPGPKGNASGCRGFRIEGIGAGKISAHNHMEWLRNCEKRPFPAGDATAGNAGESGAREESCGGEAGVLYCVFPRNPVVCPPTFGGRSVLRSARRLCPASVWDTGTGGARSGCAPPTGGEGNIISHNLFNYVNFIPRKEAANSFLPMPCICAIRCNRVASARNQKVCNILELWKNKYRLVQKRGGIWCPRRSQKGRREGPLSIPRKTSGATGEKRSHPS